VDAAGNLCITDSSNDVIRKVTASGTISTIAGVGMNAGYSGDNGQAKSALLNFPTGIVVDPSGDVYFSDSFNNVVRKINSATGIITTYAGKGLYGYSGDNGPATSAELSGPEGISLNSNGDLLIDCGEQSIRNAGDADSGR
jgi:hypothetical protein